MARRILDTNVLINHWGREFSKTRPSTLTLKDARRSAEKLIELQSSNTILTPVYLEFLCGKGSEHEVTLAKAFLSKFEIADGGRILDQDWQNAKRIAARVPRDGLRRQMGDCLIRAICDRLKLEVFTFEKRFPN